MQEAKEAMQVVMQVVKLDEAGYAPAMLGIHHSYTEEHCITKEHTMFDLGRTKKRANALCNKDGGHNKFLEQIQLWYNIRAPLYWWKEFDTYRVGVSKSSKSTMHTILSKPLKQSDFSQDVSLRTIKSMEALRLAGEFSQLISELPNGFLQTRMVNFNYRTLRNIYLQRGGHKLPEWSAFIQEVLASINHPEFINNKKE